MLPHGWAELVTLLEQGPEVDPMTRVQGLCALCQEVTGVAGVALSVATDDARSTVCATDELSNRLEDLQDTLGEGPSVDALRSGESVLVADLTASDGRWPGFTPAAFGEGVRAVFAFPLRMGAARVGTLSLYRNEAGPLDDVTAREREVLELMAEGRSNQGIADRLGISERGVQKHVTSIFDKLGIPAGTDDHRRVLAVLTFLRA